MVRVVFDKETKAMLLEFKNANGYLDCENIILKNLRKHDNNRIPLLLLRANETQ